MANLSILYAQKHRHYHDITHIQNCLAEFEAYRSDNKDNVTIDEANVVTTAIWYHDAVYNPYSKLNEFESSNLVPFSNKGPFRAVREIVILTKDHLINIDWDNLPTDALEEEWMITAAKVMLDIDLAGFGKSWEEYSHNSNHIRKEYYNTNDFDFCKGRLAFLTAMQKRQQAAGTIYYTPYFNDKYNELARRNIKTDIEVTKYYLKKC